jgi:hypothetical protein
MDEAFCARMRAAIETGLLLSPLDPNATLTENMNASGI